ncbi:MAG: hypothetical protein HKP40_03085 [Litoreibacter sp.]|nr:hypothetical protein [Litoreibacter sp.]
MAPLIGLVLGALTGAFLARKRGGSRLDMAQYGAGFAILFGVIGLFIAIFLARGAT